MTEAMKTYATLFEAFTAAYEEELKNHESKRAYLASVRGADEFGRFYGVIGAKVVVDAIRGLSESDTIQDFLFLSNEDGRVLSNIIGCLEEEFMAFHSASDFLGFICALGVCHLDAKNHEEDEEDYEEDGEE